MLIEAYAIPLAEAGIACLSLDYRHFGASSGEPRQHLIPQKQVADMRAGLDFLEARDDVDKNRLGVWGTSMSGGHAVTVAANDSRIKAAVALIPFLVTGKPSGDVGAIWRAFLKDCAMRLFGKPHSTIPIFAERPGDFAVMASDGGWDWMQEIIREAPNYQNRVTLLSLFKVGQYQPAKFARKMTVPTLLIAAKSDTITPAGPIKDFYEKMSCEKDYIEYPESHFELFGESQPMTADQTVDWFRRHL